MNTYDSPLEITYCWPVLADWGTAAPADGVYSIKGPLGMKGIVLDAGISVTEVFACDNTAAELMLGDTAGQGDYLLLVIPDATAAGDHFGTQDDVDAITGTHIPADQQVEVSVDVGVDAGTETGQGYMHFTIGWYN